VDTVASDQTRGTLSLKGTKARRGTHASALVHAKSLALELLLLLLLLLLLSPDTCFGFQRNNTFRLYMLVVNVPDMPYGKTELSVPCQVETAIPATTLLIDSSKLPPSCFFPQGPQRTAVRGMQRCGYDAPLFKVGCVRRAARATLHPLALAVRLH